MALFNLEVSFTEINVSFWYKKYRDNLLVLIQSYSRKTQVLLVDFDFKMTLSY